MFDDPPASAAWRHVEARDGFETVFMTSTRRGWRFDGHTTAVEDGLAWAVRYRILVDRQWRTRAADVWCWSATGAHRRAVRGDGTGRWRVDGQRVDTLDGCLDVDLEASACTNALPVHRLPDTNGTTHEAPAVYVRVADLTVERLEQTYTPRTKGVYDYAAPIFDFGCVLRYDRSGLVVDYPGIAHRST